MGNRFILLYHTNTLSATIVCLLTFRAKPSTIVFVFNCHKSLESHNGEKKIKGKNRSNLWPRPGVNEKRDRMDFVCPYQEPRKVPLAVKAKTSQGN